MTTYLVIAYRWGCTNLPQYVVYAGPDETKARALARAEQADRGGKYGCAVYEFDSDGTDHKLIAYHGAAMHGETEPFHNYRIDFFQSLGHVFVRYADGYETHVVDSDLVCNGKPLRVIKERPCEPPQWVLDEYERADMLLGAVTMARRK